MDSHHLGLLAIHIAVDLHHGVPQLGVFLILPGGILAHLAVITLILCGQIPQLLQQVFLLLIDGTADGESQTQIFIQTGNTQIQAGLHQALDLLAHLLDGIGHSADQGDGFGGILLRQCIAAQCVSIISLDRSGGFVKVGTDLCLQFGSDIVDKFQIIAQSDGVGLAAVANYIILSAAAIGYQAHRHFFLDTAQEFAHYLIGIGSVLMDLHTGVAGLQTIHHQTDRGAVHSLPGKGHRNGSPGAASAGNGEDALILGVDVQQHLALQHTKIDAGSTEHTCLLVNSNHQFQRRMLNVLIGRQCHSDSYSDTVVTAQGGALGEDIIAVMSQIQAVSLHIDGAIGIFFADHIHMALNDDRLVVLHTAGAGNENNHVVQLVLNVTQALLLSKVDQIIADDLGVAGAVRHGADLLKVAQYISRLQARQFNDIHSIFSFLDFFFIVAYPTPIVQ